MKEASRAKTRETTRDMLTNIACIDNELININGSQSRSLKQTRKYKTSHVNMQDTRYYPMRRKLTLFSLSLSVPSLAPFYPGYLLDVPTETDTGSRMGKLECSSTSIRHFFDTFVTFL